MLKLLGDRYADFQLLNSVEKTSYVLGSELWRTISNPYLRCML